MWGNDDVLCVLAHLPQVVCVCMCECVYNCIILVNSGISYGFSFTKSKGGKSIVQFLLELKPLEIRELSSSFGFRIWF